ncbi:facilitated trehalose transporter Tret1-like isoform X2 [Macrosteles quadrilineatus]|nr:facilitated trehalose transporter Tret1-like isoform X2 [Macrosteles quadrilineatus]
MLISTIIVTIGWILIITTRSVPVLYLVRFLFGISMGTVFTVVPLYIAEISNPEVRGALSTGFETMLYLGHVIEFAIGPYVSYNTLALTSITIPVGFLILSFWMVDSPYFLLKEGRYLEARQTYSKLSGINDDQEIINHLAGMEEHFENGKKSSLKDLFGSRVYFRSLLIVLVLAVVQRFSGMSAVVAYASFIFPTTIGGLSSSEYTILFGVITLLFTFVSAALMDRAGRRILTITSCFGSFIVEFLTALYFFLDQQSLVDTSHVTWLPFLTISMYAGFYSVGMGPVVTTIQGELFPPNVKGLASSIVAIVHGASSSLVTKSYQIVTDSFGVYVSFWLFSINCLLGSIFAYFIMPETKGKTLLELHSRL